VPGFLSYEEERNIANLFLIFNRTMTARQEQDARKSLTVDHFVQPDAETMKTAPAYFQIPVQTARFCSGQ
jgi:hypothetical protein